MHTEWVIQKWKQGAVVTKSWKWYSSTVCLLETSHSIQSTLRGRRWRLHLKVESLRIWGCILKPTHTWAQCKKLSEQKDQETILKLEIISSCKEQAHSRCLDHSRHELEWYLLISVLTDKGNCWKFYTWQEHAWQVQNSFRQNQRFLSPAD